jgi:hypothetical protein
MLNLTMDELLRDRPRFSTTSSETQMVNGTTKGEDGRHADTVCIDSFHPELKGDDHRIDILILSWVLLLCRRSLEQNPEDLAWGFASFVPGSSLPAKTMQGGISDVVTSETESISAALEQTRRLRSSACEVQGGNASVEFILAASHKTDVSSHRHKISVAPIDQD